MLRCMNNVPPRCLVADDVRHIAARVCEALTDGGAEVVGTACNGLQAIELFDRLAPDAAVLDFNMPGLDGLAVTRAIREREQRSGGNGHCLVVILTSHAEPSIREQCLADGVDHFLHKASDFDRLGSVVRSGVEARQRGAR